MYFVYVGDAGRSMLLTVLLASTSGEQTARQAAAFSMKISFIACGSIQAMRFC